MFHVEELRTYCLHKKGVTEEFPFGPETLVYKVMGKAFVLTGMEYSPLRINLKMNPELIPQYRDKNTYVQPAYHMNKNHWNSVYVDASVSKKEILWMIDHSYQQVVNGFTKKQKEALSRL